MSDSAAKPRPQYRNIDIPTILFGYRLPPQAILSILHRVSGAALFLALPLLLLPLFERSLISEIGFAELRDIVSHPLVKVVLLGLIWAYLHHFCAGIRFLLLDVHVGLAKEAARRSAGISFAVSLALTAVFGLKLFGVF